MDYFNYHNAELYAEEIPVTKLVKEYGTPLYIYSRRTLERHWKIFDSALQDQPHEICYAVKANSNLAVLNVLAKLGSGFDIVSLGELERVLAAKGNPKKVIFSGVGKLNEEIEQALEIGIACFNVESKPELDRIHQIASKQSKVAPIAFRVNPNVDPRTHRYISTGLKENKFGVDMDEALALYELAAKSPYLQTIGVACHIGSQLQELQPFLDAFDRVYQLVLILKEKGFPIHQLDLGGGLGVRYQSEKPPEPAEYAQALLQRLPDKKLKIILEPGRAIAANAGILITRTEYLKHTGHKNFAVVDAAMNDLLRPALYEAAHEIVPVIMKEHGDFKTYDVVGPVCETGDFLAKDRALNVAEGDLLAIRTAGAYGFSMSSNYNSRPRAAEVMVDGKHAFLVRPRETRASLFADEKILS